MASSRGVFVCSVVVGFMTMVVAFGCIAGGAVAIYKLEDLGVASIGIWAVYFLISSTVNLVAGFGRYHSWFVAAIGVNVLGLLLALAGMGWAALFWAVFDACGSITIGEKCPCILNSNKYNLDLKCKDVKDVQYATAAVTILYAVLSILSFIGSILGCAVACCGRREYRGRMYPGAYVVPVGNPNSMMMTRIGERRYVDSDPYPYKERYMPAPTQYREPYIDDRYDRKRNRGYVEERHYGYSERHADEKPSYHPNRGLPAPHHGHFAVDPSDDRYDRRRNRGYVEERHYGHNERYADEKPSYHHSNRGLPAAHHENFVVDPSDDEYSYPSF